MKLRPKCVREEEGHQVGIKGLSVRCVGKERKRIVQILWGVNLYIGAN